MVHYAVQNGGVETSTRHAAQPRNEGFEVKLRSTCASGQTIQAGSTM
jgi:hypothetical protein